MPLQTSVIKYNSAFVNTFRISRFPTCTSTRYRSTDRFTAALKDEGSKLSNLLIVSAFEMNAGLPDLFVAMFVVGRFPALWLVNHLGSINPRILVQFFRKPTCAKKVNHFRFRLAYLSRISIVFTLPLSASD